MAKLCIKVGGEIKKLDLDANETSVKPSSSGTAYTDQGFVITVTHPGGLKEAYGTVKTISAGLNGDMFQKTVTLPANFFTETPIMFGNALSSGSGYVCFSSVSKTSFKVGCVREGGENANRAYGSESWVSWHAVGY